METPEADDITHRIREHAYLLWEAAGCPDGRADEFWHRANEVELGMTTPAEPAGGAGSADDFA